MLQSYGMSSVLHKRFGLIQFAETWDTDRVVSGQYGVLHAMCQHSLCTDPLKIGDKKSWAVKVAVQGEGGVLSLCRICHPNYHPFLNACRLPAAALSF